MRVNFGRVVIGAGCAYELFALIAGGVPTITDIVKHTHRHPVGRFFVWMWCGLWAWHFLEPEP